MSTSASSQLRQQLVDSLRSRGALRGDNVARAFLAVPREIFVPGIDLDEVYRDQAITTKEQAGVPVSSSSQPAMMALMLEQLDIQPGMRVLEVGSGTGYNAALLQELTGDDGRVTSLEIDPEVAAWAHRRLAAAGYTRVDVIQIDGANGWPAGAPYDRVELTVGTADISPAWVDQLVAGGILVVPLWINTVQLSVAMVKREGALESRSALPCGFTRIRGSLAGTDQYRTLQPGVMIATGSTTPVDDLVRHLIAGAPRIERIDGRSWHGFTTFLALRDDATLMVAATDERVTGFSGPAFGLADIAGRSLCLISYPVEGDGLGTILSYGGPGARERIGRLLESWRAAGSPDVSDLRITLQPRSQTYVPAAGVIARETGFWRLLFGYPDAQK